MTCMPAQAWAGMEHACAAQLPFALLTRREASAARD